MKEEKNDNDKNNKNNNKINNKKRKNINKKNEEKNTNNDKKKKRKKNSNKKEKNTNKEKKNNNEENKLPPKKIKIIRINRNQDIGNIFDQLLNEAFNNEYPYDNGGYPNPEDSYYSEESYTEDEEDLEYEEINHKIDTIDDLIKLGKLYNPRKRYNIDLKRLNNLVEPLEKLKNTIGMESVKKSLVGQIIFQLQNLNNGDGDMLHTVIQGPPGVGKTMLGRILGEIYYKMGVIKGNKPRRDRRGKIIKKEDDFVFRIVKRSDLIGKYLGHTAAKTQEVIDSCKGGVLFIDEAYSLGNAEGRDTFSKECIDTLNQNLSENKNNLLCIIAGYKDSLEKCFFSYNEGLNRRFSFRYTIEPYTAEQLRDIFLSKVKEINWNIKSEKDVPLTFFKENYKTFKHYGGDMETLLLNCKIEHSKRVFFLADDKKRYLTRKDIDNGFKIFKENRKNKDEDKHFLSNLYL